ncbi:MAG: TRAP transporter substrate-binding protein [Alphaproteobacteria bacterium]|nr:TRAP transporter substrate-binding protein [Alphaproteobacteria bacterium]
MRFAKNATAALALAGLLLPATFADAKEKFTLGTTNSTKMLSVQAMQKWADGMRASSNGELDMQIIAGGALGGDKQLLQQLSTNEIQAHVAGPVVVHHLVKDYQCMEAEFVYKDGNHGLRVWRGPLGQEVDKLLQKKHGIRMVGVGHRGARHLTSKVPVSSPSDMKGLKIRITNKLRQKVFKAFGANPVPMSFKELYGALQTGTVEAQENPLGTIYGTNFYEVQDYVNKTGHVWSYFVVTANNDFYNKLSPKNRKIFDDEAKKAVDWMTAEVWKSFEEYEKKLKAKGMKVVKPDVAAFQKIAAPIVSAFAKETCRPGLLADIAKQAQ